MLREAKLAMRIVDPEYEPDLCRLLKAGEMDLRMAGILFDGECAFEITVTTDAITGVEAVTVTDNSTIEDEMVKTAIITYAGARGDYYSREDKDQLQKSYDLQRRQLANATGYTEFGEDDEG